MEVQINLLGIELLVNLEYTPAEEETNSNADIELYEVWLFNDSSETDISALLEYHEEKIKELVIEKIEE
jgi:hypothetical protein